jgi:HK97 family phage prohead protease
MADKPKVGEVETRQAEIATEGRRIRGIVPFNVESRDMGGWKEVISPSALRNAKLDDLIARVDHAGVPIGRFPKTLDVEERGDGLHWSVEPPSSRQDLVEAVERGDLAAGSWQMVVGKDRWAGDTRYVEQIKELRDVSVVSTPAYPDAAIEYRAAPNTKERMDSMSEDKTPPERAEEARSEDKKTEERSQPTASNSSDVKVVNEPKPSAGALNVEERTEAMSTESLAGLFEQRGFFENRSASVSWDEYRSFTWSAGTVLTDVNPNRLGGVDFGYDSRWVFPAVPNVAVDASTTSIQYLRQSARSLAAGTAVVRALDSVATKPETSSTAELKTLQLNQVATVQTNIPRIHAAQPLFQNIVEADLRYAVNDGLDKLVVDGLATAGTAAAVTGDVLQKIRRAVTVVQASGYSPNTLAIDPAGAEALDLLQTSGTEKYYVFNAGAAAPAPYGLSIRVRKSAGTALFDSRAFGELYVAPLELRSFEADAGTTNRQNVRLETNAGFAVQRVEAALRIL